MTNRERLRRTLAGDCRVDRLPMIEWVDWWDVTLARWKEEDPALPRGRVPLMEHFGLDSYHHYWLQIRKAGIPTAAYHGAPIFSGESDFRRNVLPYLFDTSHFLPLREALLKSKPLHDAGDVFVWYTLEGFFWFPRTLWGIENHLYAFYDAPELMQEVNEKLVDFHIRSLEVLYDVLTPEFMSFAEDMSYNHGPMLSKVCFDAMLLPCYRKIVSLIRAQGTKVFIDTDGNVEPLMPWFQAAGIDGVLPLERQAGVDIRRIREQYPDWLMIGGYDKTVMHHGESAMRAEFERVLPAMRNGRYIPSVDHQTPPDVSVAQYRVYVALLQEYARRAVEDKP